MSSTKSKSVGLLYIGPALLFVATFTLYPLGQLIWMSLHNCSLLGGVRFIGFGNYFRAYQDPTFWSALTFTVKYTLILTPILMIFGYLIALLTSGRSRLVKLTRAIVFIPVVIGIGSSSLLGCGCFNRKSDSSISCSSICTSFRSRWFGSEQTPASVSGE